jgi:hypothetical protein
LLALYDEEEKLNAYEASLINETPVLK